MMYKSSFFGPGNFIYHVTPVTLPEVNEDEVSISTSILFALQEVLPSQEEVVRRTEAITRCIQELLISAKDEKVSEFYFLLNLNRDEK